MRFRANWVLTQVLPKNRVGDFVYCTLNFLIRNRRLPSRGHRFNDRIHRLKVTDYALRPEVGFTSCKHLVKQYVAAVIGPEHTVPTLALLQTVESVRGFAYPDACVIKATQSSGDNVLRKAGEPLDLEEIAGWLDRNYYLERRETNYRHLTPGVIVEPYVFNDEHPDDYKVFLFRGRAKLIQIDTDRASRHARAFYDRAWNRAPGSLKVPEANKTFEKPLCLEPMLDAAEKLAAPFEFVRVDFYVSGRQFAVGEITHFHGNGWERFIPANCEQAINDIVFSS